MKSLLAVVLLGLSLVASAKDEIVVVQPDIHYEEFIQTITEATVNFNKVYPLLMILTNNQYLQSQSQSKQDEFWGLVNLAIAKQQAMFEQFDQIESCTGK